VSGLGPQTFQAILQKLPLVATDEALFALAAELGWCATWLQRRAPPVPANEVAAPDIAVLLGRQHGRPVPPPARAGGADVAPVPSSAVICDFANTSFLCF